MRERTSSAKTSHESKSTVSLRKTHDQPPEHLLFVIDMLYSMNIFECFFHKIVPQTKKSDNFDERERPNLF